MGGPILRDQEVSGSARPFSSTGHARQGQAARAEKAVGDPKVSRRKNENGDEARAKAEAKFRKQEHTKAEAHKVWAERAVTAEAGEKQRAKLKGLRLARDAAEKAAPDKQEPNGAKAKRTSKTSA